MMSSNIGDVEKIIMEHVPLTNLNSMQQSTFYHPTQQHYTTAMPTTPTAMQHSGLESTPVSVSAMPLPSINHLMPALSFPVMSPMFASIQAPQQHITTSSTTTTAIMAEELYRLNILSQLSLRSALTENNNVKAWLEYIDNTTQSENIIRPYDPNSNYSKNLTKSEILQIAYASYYNADKYRRVNTTVSAECYATRAIQYFLEYNKLYLSAPQMCIQHPISSITPSAIMEVQRDHTMAKDMLWRHIVDCYLLLGNIAQDNHCYTRAHDLFQMALTYTRSHLFSMNGYHTGCLREIIDNCELFKPVLALKWKEELAMINSQCAVKNEIPSFIKNTSGGNGLSLTSSTSSNSDETVTSNPEFSLSMSTGMSAGVASASIPTSSTSSSGPPPVMAPVQEQHMHMAPSSFSNPLSMDAAVVGGGGNTGVTGLATSPLTPSAAAAILACQPLLPPQLPNFDDPMMSNAPLQLPNSTLFPTANNFSNCGNTVKPLNNTTVAATNGVSQAPPPMPTHIGTRRRRPKTFQCNDCGRWYSSKESLRAHARVHTSAACVCPDCGKRFPNIHKLKVHSTCHTGLQPYQCDVCNRKFSDKANMKRHYRRHTGEKPFQCEHCPKRFTDSTALVDHTRRRHTKEKPFQCECGKRFVSSSDLKNHGAVHSNVRPFQCSVCGTRFKRKNDYKKHMVRFHDQHV